MRQVWRMRGTLELNILDIFSCHRFSMWPNIVMLQQDTSTKQSMIFFDLMTGLMIPKEVTVHDTGDCGPLDR